MMTEKMAPRDALSELARAVGVLIDDALIEVSDVKAWLSPPLLHQVKGMLFRVNYYGDFTLGDTVIPRVNWSGHPALGYSDAEIERLFNIIRNRPEFTTALSQLVEAENRSRDEGTLRLYLVCFAYYIETAILKNRWVDIQPLVDGFLRDLQEDSLRVVARFGLRGISVKDESIEISPGVALRRLLKSDYHDVFEPLADRSFRDVPFPSEYHDSAVLEASGGVTGKLNEMYGYRDFVDVRMYSSVREFDLLIGPAFGSASSWRHALWLVQSDANIKTGFQHVELYLPALSSEPVYRYEWKEGGSWQEARGTFSVSKSDAQFLDLMRTLVARDYSTRLYPHEGRQTPLSLAYSRYVEILDSYESSEARVQRIIEALEAFFTPESDRLKVFVQRVVHLVKSLAVDENDTENLLLNAYSIRSAHVHRGEGWDEFHPPVSTTDHALHAWQSYAGDLASVLLTYLHLSIVSRVLSQSDERTYIEMLDKS